LRNISNPIALAIVALVFDNRALTIRIKHGYMGAFESKTGTISITTNPLIKIALAKVLDLFYDQKLDEIGHNMLDVRLYKNMTASVCWTSSPLEYIRADEIHTSVSLYFVCCKR
jgi:hypothetical protein